MALQPQKSSSSLRGLLGPLHNFKLPTWGAQKLLRCAKVDPNTDFHQSDVSEPMESPKKVLGIKRRSSSPSSMVNSGYPKTPPDEIKAVPEKIMLDPRETDKIGICKEKELEDQSGFVRPWNLRTRRAACKAPGMNAVVFGCGSGGGKGKNGNMWSPVGRQESRFRGGLGILGEQRGERPKFSFSLSKEEIESDFLDLTGNKPQRRPKKRPRVVQRQLDALVPGLGLMEITPETYKVPDVPETRKGQS